MVGVRVYEAISRFGQHVVPGRDDESDDAVLKSYLYLTRHLTLFCVRVRPPLSFWRPCHVEKVLRFVCEWRTIRSTQTVSRPQVWAATISTPHTIDSEGWRLMKYMLIPSALEMEVFARQVDLRIATHGTPYACCMRLLFGYQFGLCSSRSFPRSGWVVKATNSPSVTAYRVQSLTQALAQL